MTCEENKSLGWGEWFGVRMWAAPVAWGCELLPLYPPSEDSPLPAMSLPVGQFSTAAVAQMAREEEASRRDAEGLRLALAEKPITLMGVFDDTSRPYARGCVDG